MGGVQQFRTRAKYLPRLGCSTPPSHFPNGVYFSRELDSAFETTGTNDLKNQASSWLDNCQKNAARIWPEIEKKPPQIFSQVFSAALETMPASLLYESIRIERSPALCKKILFCCSVLFFWKSLAMCCTFLHIFTHYNSFLVFLVQHSEVGPRTGWSRPSLGIPARSRHWRQIFFLRDRLLGNVFRCFWTVEQFLWPFPLERWPIAFSKSIEPSKNTNISSISFWRGKIQELHINLQDILRPVHLIPTPVEANLKQPCSSVIHLLATIMASPT